METILILPFFIWPFFFPPQVKHMQTSTSHITFSHPPEQNQNNWFSVSEPLCSTITESRQQPVIRLGPFIPVFKQKLDMIMKGILWHHFLFIAGDSTQWPRKCVPLCDHTVHRVFKLKREWLLPSSLTCSLCRPDNFICIRPSNL